MLAIGDKVEIRGRQGDPTTGKFGRIVQIHTEIKPDTQPASVNLPKRDTEPRYSVKLNNGEVVRHLMEQQLRKLS